LGLTALAVLPEVFSWVSEGVGLKAAVISLAAEGQGLGQWAAKTLLDPTVRLTLGLLLGAVAGYVFRGAVEKIRANKPTNDQLELQNEANEQRRAEVLDQARRQLGREMISVSHFVSYNGIGVRFDPSEKARLMNMHHYMVKFSVPVPDFDTLASSYSRKFCAEYLELVGHLLSDGPFEIAREQAEKCVASWPRP
jgi:hypothetical protein